MYERRIHKLANQSQDTGVPDMPFRKDWYKVVMRDAVNEAIALDKDGVSWSTAKILADRYNKFADEFVWRYANGTYELTFLRGGEELDIGGNEYKRFNSFEI